MSLAGVAGVASAVTKLKNKGSVTVQVVVRCRPLNKKEVGEERKPIIGIDASQVSIVKRLGHDGLPLKEEERQSKSFTFDAAYDEQSTQKQFYEESCYPLVESVMEGFNGTIFAYGQTGCGKSWTMMGPPSPVELKGVIPNSFDHIFEHITTTKDVEFLVRCSYLEIYNEEIRDLLGDDPKARCELKEDPSKGVYVKGLSSVVVNDEATINQVMEKGLKHRTTGATLMNEGSSRSHSIFTVVLEMNTKDEKGKDHFTMGKLNLVDLAGSERANKTGASGDRLKEGCKINLSLSALGNVISALVDAKCKHIPYRDSKLTRLLQDSLGGNTKTLMMAAVSPADYNYDETLSTLRYANRAKNIKNKPKINEDPKDAMLREYKAQIDQLKAILEAQAAGQPLDGRWAGEGQPTLVQAPGTNTVVHAPGTHTVVEKVVTKEGPVRIKEVEKIVVVEKEKVVEKIVVQEKIVNVMNAEGEALSEYNAALVNQRAELGGQLEGQKVLTEQAQQDVGAVMAKLAALQARVVGGGSFKRGEMADGDAAFELALKKKRDKAKRIKKRLEKKGLIAREAEEGRLAAELEREAVELELQEAALEMDERERKFVREKKKLKRKILNGEREIEDLHDEFQREREMLQDNVREANRDAQLWRQVCEVVLPKELVARVWQRSEFDEREDTWVLPEMLRAKRQFQDLSCPPLPGMGSQIADGALFDRPRSRSPRAVGGLAGAARPGSRSPRLEAARYSPRPGEGAAFYDPPREEYSRPASSAIPSRPSSSRPGSTRPHSRPMVVGTDAVKDRRRREKKERKREERRQREGDNERPETGRPGGLAGAAVGGLAAAAVGGLAGAASKPPRDKPPRQKKKAVGGLAGAAVSGLAAAAARPIGGLAGAAANYDYDIASP